VLRSARHNESDCRVPGSGPPPLFWRARRFKEEGQMRSRTLIGAFIMFALVAGVTLVAKDSTFVGMNKQWTVTNFANPVLVNGRVIMGPVLIVHDSDKMKRGEACTTFYRFDPARGGREELVSFHCLPKETAPIAETKFTTMSTDAGCKKLVEYQIAGDSEAHLVPVK